MKKWYVIVLSVVAFVVLMVVGGSIFYKYYLIPEYIAPVMEKVKEYVNEEAVLDDLYEHAVRLREEGVIDESTYADFVNAYEKNNRDNESYAREILNAKENDDNLVNSETTSISTRYASNRVGVEIIQTNDGESKGTATKRYSEERTSDRIKAEDIVEAEKVINSEAPEDEVETEEEVKQNAYTKLKSHMTADEFKTFLSIMSKMDTNILASFVDKENKTLINTSSLKEYMHSCLTDDEYKQIVNLGYKYVYLFVED